MPPFGALTCWSEKLRLDFAHEASMCRGMPTHAHHEHLDLIATLCLEAGRIMEDESPGFALKLPESTTKIIARLQCARQAGEDIAALVAAAQVLLRRGEPSS